MVTKHRATLVSLVFSALLIPAAPVNGKPILKGEKGSWVVTEFIATTPQRAWGILSNYNLLAELAPDIKDARVIKRQGNTLELEQTYKAGYTFGLPIRARLSITELPNRGFNYKLIEGQHLNALKGSWSITAVAGGIQLRHQMQVDPQVPGPLRPIYDQQQEANLVRWLEILKRRMESGTNR